MSNSIVFVPILYAVLFECFSGRFFFAFQKAVLCNFLQFPQDFIFGYKRWHEVILGAPSICFCGFWSSTQKGLKTLGHVFRIWWLLSFLSFERLFKGSHPFSKALFKGKQRKYLGFLNRKHYCRDNGDRLLHVSARQKGRAEHHYKDSITYLTFF